jgi:hypothetical protein
MSNVAKAKVETTIQVPSYAIPVLLTLNTFALVAIDQLGGIPAWIKGAAAIFLAF